MSSHSEHVVNEQDPPVSVPSEEMAPVAPPTIEEPLAPPAEEPTVGTGSYVGASCALGMLLLTIVLIGVVYLLRWFG